MKRKTKKKERERDFVVVFALPPPLFALSLFDFDFDFCPFLLRAHNEEERGGQRGERERARESYGVRVWVEAEEGRKSSSFSLSFHSSHSPFFFK